MKKPSFTITETYKSQHHGMFKALFPQWEQNTIAPSTEGSQWLSCVFLHNKMLLLFIRLVELIVTSTHIICLQNNLDRYQRTILLYAFSMSSHSMACYFQLACNYSECLIVWHKSYPTLTQFCPVVSDLALMTSSMSAQFEVLWLWSLRVQG